jgi:GT2 family glycosyltransferase/glycosyltransferase involved in cell wall biosynthesis
MVPLMDLKRTIGRIRIVRDAARMLVAISRRDQNLSQVAQKMISIIRREGPKGVKRRIISLASVLQSSPKALSYTAWTSRFDSLGPDHVAAAKIHLATLELPELLIVAIVGKSDLEKLHQATVSWKTSIHEKWRVVLVPSDDLEGADRTFVQNLAEADPRFSFIETGKELEAAWSRSAYTLFCFGAVQLNPLSSYMLLEAAQRTAAEVVYCDNDYVDSRDMRVDPDFKPQPSPTYLSQFNYLGDCVLVSRSACSTERTDRLVACGIDAFDRFISATAAGRRAEHVPFILFHVLNRKIRATFAPPSITDNGSSVAIIIPTRDGLSYLKPCLESVLLNTSYDMRLVEILVVDNNSEKAETLAFLDEIATRPNVRVLKYPHPFNFAKINNFAAMGVDKDVIVFLNNDTVVNDAAWLSKMVWYARQPGTGVVGAKLLFPNRTIQHGGCAAGVGNGTVSHLWTHHSADEISGGDRTREMSLMTGACYAIRRSVFEDVGGFDPILAITWNDVKLCLDCLDAGYRNIYIADPLMFHDESKTREKDKTRESMGRFFEEAHYTRLRFRDYFFDDPSYNPNLSVEQANELAQPPRVMRPWLRTGNGPERILVLSSVYKIGFGVPLVIQQHVAKLVELGYEVIIGGPVSEKDFAFPGCERVSLLSAREAACFAFERDVALIISHTPPFFIIPTLIGAHIPVLAYDYGEPPAELFPEPTRSYLLDVEYEKRAAASLTTTIATISQAVKDETMNADAVVVGLANSHLPAWTDAQRTRREDVRSARKWNDRFVVLTVCRFSENERVYKGIDKIARIVREFTYLHPEQAQNLTWALAGAGGPDDVKQAEALGFTVFPNLPDDDLTGLYSAADAYMSFSRWEGYNLGISQALAMGLPTLASDIPAHREFPIETTNSVLTATRWLSQQINRQEEADRTRCATVYDWDVSATRFAELVETTLRNQRPVRPRSGSYGAELRT